MKKILVILLTSVLVIAYTVLLGGYIFIRPQLSTLYSVEKLNDHPFYKLNYTSDYYFDEYLKTGGATIEDTIEFVAEKMNVDVLFPETQSDFACATIYSPTTDGDYIFARNFDYKHAPAMLVYTDPEDGYKSVSMVNLGDMGYNGEDFDANWDSRKLLLFVPYCPMDGMNEKGVAIGVLQLDNNPTAQDNGKTDIMTTTAIRLVLDYAADVEEAIDLLSQYDMHSVMHTNYHYQISDAKGNSAIVEYKNNNMHVYRNKDSYQFCTNFYITDMVNGTGAERHCPRYQGLISAFEQGNGSFSAENIKGLAEKVSNNYTQWTSVFNLTDLSYDIYIDCKYNKPYHFELGDLGSNNKMTSYIDMVFIAVGVLIAVCIGLGLILSKRKAKKSKV